MPLPWYKRFFKFLMRLLLQVLLVILISYVLMQVYLRKFVDQQTKDAFSAQDINMSSVGGLVTGLKNQAALLREKLDQRQQYMDQLLNRDGKSDGQNSDRYIYSVK